MASTEGSGSGGRGQEPAKILSLAEARNRFGPGKCQHNRLIIDADLNQVLCENCGAGLHPIAMLARFAKEKSRWAVENAQRRDLLKELDARVRCKCQHCWQMTRIRV